MLSIFCLPLKQKLKIKHKSEEEEEVRYVQIISQASSECPSRSSNPLNGNVPSLY